MKVKTGHFQAKTNRRQNKKSELIIFSSQTEELLERSCVFVRFCYLQVIGMVDLVPSQQGKIGHLPLPMLGAERA